VVWCGVVSVRCVCVRDVVWCGCGECGVGCGMVWCGVVLVWCGCGVCVCDVVWFGMIVARALACGGVWGVW